MTDECTCAKCDYTAEDFERVADQIEENGTSLHPLSPEEEDIAVTALREAAEGRWGGGAVDVVDKAKAWDTSCASFQRGYEKGKVDAALKPDIGIPISPAPDREAAIEAAARQSYEYEGHRKGVKYIGWENELDDIRSEWRSSVRVVLDAYEARIRAALVDGGSNG
ncbi:MAG: hypothetical protein AB7E55_26195 [Pigmentiphaga sp.]